MHPDQDWCTAKISIIDLTSLLCIKANLMCHCYNAHNCINKICLKWAKLNLHYKNVKIRDWVGADCENRGLTEPRHERTTSACSQSSSFTNHTGRAKQRFQISPLWRAFSNLSVFSGRKRRRRVDENRIRKNTFVRIYLTDTCGPGLK